MTITGILLLLIRKAVRYLSDADIPTFFLAFEIFGLNHGIADRDSIKTLVD